MKTSLKFAFAAVVLNLLAACGGGSSSAPPVAPPASSAPVVTPPVVTPPVVTPPVSQAVLPEWESLMGACEHPRTGLQPNGQPYPDRQGALTDELKWLRFYIDDSYLWYKEVPSNLNMADYGSAIDYFAVLKTPLTTASGRPKDRFHFTYPSEVWDAMSNEGVELTYGVNWARGTDARGLRAWSVATVEPGSPADQAGMRRGDALLTVDGVSIADNTVAGVALLNAGLFPVGAGETHQMVLSRDGVQRTVALKSLQLALAPVQNVKLLPTATGAVGYLLFNDHNAVAEAQLASAFAGFKSAGVTDLVLDMRYNGGGLLSIASELAYMVAGPDATRGKVFDQLLYNDKTPPQKPSLFQSTATGSAPAALKPGAALPYLGLKRVTVLATPETCSASEAVVNGLRGIDIEVNLIGGGTCGKPYAFYPTPNCGTTYFAIQMQGTNNKGFGDYADGFAPTCKADDDLGHALGDPAEGLLATALSYRANGVCPAVPLRARALSARAPAPATLPLGRPDVKGIAILDR
jgi:carboxyl-terminal processing protease